MTKIKNAATDEGRELGHHMARFCDQAEQIARLKVPELPPRCASCAFREGPHVANGSPQTQMDAVKAWIEGHEFYCHEPARKDHLCSGWSMLMLAKDKKSDVELPWNFSNEPTPPGGT